MISETWGIVRKKKSGPKDGPGAAKTQKNIKKVEKIEKGHAGAWTQDLIVTGAHFNHWGGDTFVNLYEMINT